MTNMDDDLLNSHWWAQALAERHAIDMEHHVGERAHQRVSHATAENVPGPDYVLTEWDKEWLAARVADAHELHAKQHEAAQSVLSVSPDEHEDIELRAKAVSYFGATHEQTVAKLKGLRENSEDDAMISRIDEYLDLVERHIATVKAEVAEKRRVAQKHSADYEQLSATPIEQHVSTCHAKVLDQIRSR